ncbi:hypothetical protein GF312_12550 [Candidatus Poribacteria bacterium]|nr:hypothetical protein [Candidatus Poribacteria bacterium]
MIKMRFLAICTVVTLFVLPVTANDFPDEIMGIDLMKALDETISDIDNAFEDLKDSEEGIEIRIQELQKQIDAEAQKIAQGLRPGSKPNKIEIYQMIGDNANIVQLQEQAINLYKKMLYKRINTISQVIDLNSKLGDLLEHKEMLDKRGDVDKEAMYKYQDSMIGFAKAFTGLEDVISGDLFDEIAAIDPNMAQKRETIKYSWELFQSQLEDFMDHDEETVDMEWIVDYYQEIQNNVSYTLNEAFLMLDESLAWEDRLRQKGLTVALELLSAKLTKAHNRMGNLKRPPKVKKLPKIGDIISKNTRSSKVNSANLTTTPGESWRDRVERIDRQVKARRKESGSK